MEKIRTFQISSKVTSVISTKIPLYLGSTNTLPMYLGRVIEIPRYIGSPNIAPMFKSICTLSMYLGGSKGWSK